MQYRATPEGYEMEDGMVFKPYAEPNRPKVGEVWKTRSLGGYLVHIEGTSCGPFPIIGRVMIGGATAGWDTLWCFSRDGVSSDADDRAFDLVERVHG